MRTPRATDFIAAMLVALRPIHILSADLAYDDFSSIGCKTEPVNCITYSDLAGQFTTVEEEIVVSCDVCVNMDEFKSGEELFLNGGVKVHGLLYFPQGTSVSISLPHLVVEGKMIMDAVGMVDGEPEINIIMTGTDELQFVPKSNNANACKDSFEGTDYCDFGKKVIAVAGGSVDIRGLSDTCPTWANLLDVITAPPKNLSNATPADPICSSRTLLKNTFESEFEYWTGSIGTKWLIENTNSSLYMKVRERHREWQGPTITLNDSSNNVAKCIIPEEVYLFNAKVKLDSANGTSSSCSVNGTNCIEIKLHTYSQAGELTWKSLHKMQPSAATGDGEWFDYSARLMFAEGDLDDDDVYQLLYLGGPEGGIDISVDDITIEMAPLDAYPDPDAPCEQMISNGDASAHNIHTFPMNIFGNDQNILSVVHSLSGTNETKYFSYMDLVTDTSAAKNNSFFKLSGRRREWNSIEIPLPKGCLEEFSVYHFTGRVWIQTPTTTNIRFSLKSEKHDGSYKLHNLGSCPAANITSGWVECSRYFLLEEEHLDAKEIQIFFVTEGTTSDIWYDDLSLTLHVPPVKSLILPASVAECWGQGAEILITSHTMNLNDTVVREIAEVTTDGDQSIVTMTKGVRKPTTVVDSPDFAVEVALLSRNIRFTSADDDPVYDDHGGHFMIVRTPDTKQYVQGVEFLRFGQQSIRGRYPIQIYLNNDYPTSFIGKNTIRDSFQRCVVVQGTNNMTISENVALNTFGHCYVIQDGYEQHNTFYRNLGAVTKIIPDSGIITVLESDTFASTFWISNPNNDFVENVCAGSEDNGFWYELLDAVRGPSTIFDSQYKINPSQHKFGSFQRNIMHSNQGDGLKLYPNGYFPENESPFHDVRSFRNKGNGVLFHNSANMTLSGGVFADNRVQVEIDKQAEAMRISNAKIIGSSTPFMSEVEYGHRSQSHCPANRAVLGVQLHSYLRFRDSDGYILENLSFEGFNDTLTGCVESTAIHVDAQTRDKHFDAYAILKNLTFEEDSPMSDRFNICDLAASGIRDLAIDDVSGDLNPNATGAKGWIVSDNSLMTTFVEGECHEMEGSCSLFCEGENLCYRSMTLGVSQAEGYEGMELSVTDEYGNQRNFPGLFEKRMKIHRNEKVENIYDNYIYQRRRYFSPILPSGNYTMKFVQNNQDTWPGFYETSWRKPPNCTGYIESEHVEIIEPAPTFAECEQVIKHHDLEEGTMNHWVHSGGSLQIVSPGYNSDYAISSVHRSGTWQGPAQFLDTRCLVEGSYFEIILRYRLHYDGQFVGCKPNSDHYMGTDVCPRVTFRMREVLGDDANASVTNTYAFPIANPVYPNSAEDWNLLVGIVYISKEIAEADSVMFLVERGRPGQNIIIDDVTMSETIHGCNDKIRNRGFESGDSRFWGTYGHVDLEMTSPGNDGSEHAMRTVYRDSYWASMSHEIDTSCLIKNMEYSISADIKLNWTYRDGFPNFWCHSLWKWGWRGRTDISCPLITLRITKGGASTEKEFGRLTGDIWNSGQWNTLHGVITATDEIMNADSVFIYFTKVVKDVTITVDKLSVMLIENYGCNNVILNGDFEEGDERFWLRYGSSRIDVLEPGGAAGHSSSALRIFNRGNVHGGAQQTIKTDCLEVGVIYEVNVMIKMVDRNTYNPIGCDINATSDWKPRRRRRSSRCPHVTLISDGQGPRQSRMIGQAEVKWAAEGWNAVTGKFTFFSSEINADELIVMINRAPHYTDMLMDDFRITRLDLVDKSDIHFLYGTSSPSVAPSATPSITVSPSSVNATNVTQEAIDAFMEFADSITNSSDGTSVTSDSQLSP